MTSIKRDITINCPSDQVFAVLADVDRLPEFSDMTVAVENAPGRPLQVGDHFDQIIKILGIEIDTEWEVTEIEADTRIRIEGRTKSNGKASLTEHVAADGHGCKVTFDVEYDPPLGLLGDIADKVLFERSHEEQAEQILSRLKALCEAPVPA